jgi:hypothetical protein
MGTILNSETVSTLTLPVGKSEAFFWDNALVGFGLRLRVGSGGKVLRSFVFRYRHDGQQRREKIKNHERQFGAAGSGEASRQGRPRH